MAKKKILTVIVQQIGISMIPPGLIAAGVYMNSYSLFAGVPVILIGAICLLALWAGQVFAIKRRSATKVEVCWMVGYNLALIGLLGIFFNLPFSF